MTSYQLSTSPPPSVTRAISTKTNSVIQPQPHQAMHNSFGSSTGDAQHNREAAELPSDMLSMSVSHAQKRNNNNNNNNNTSNNASSNSHSGFVVLPAFQISSSSSASTSTAPSHNNNNNAQHQHQHHSPLGGGVGPHSLSHSSNSHASAGHSNNANDANDNNKHLAAADAPAVDVENSQPSVLYKDGVVLKNGVEHIQFEDSYYIGTVDGEGAMAGYGKATFSSGDTYEGEWLHDRMHGNGHYRWSDGDYYIGAYVDGFMHGFGEMHDATGVYVGEWVDDMRQGRGRMVYKGGNEYEGEWLGGMRHGHGKLTETSGLVYEGEFARNEKEGKGIQCNADGDVYEGEFANGKPNGKGTYLWVDGAKYVGFFKDGLKHGEGCEWLPNGDWIAGHFINGEHDQRQAVHKAVAVDYVQAELPDEAGTAMEPLDAKQMLRLTIAANAAEQKALGKEPAAMSPQGYNTGSDSKQNGEMNKMGEGSSPSGDANSAPLSPSASATSPFGNALRPMLLTDRDLENWTQLKIIGKGSFGAVYEALLTSGRTVCCKVIELGNIENRDELDKLKNEIALMKRLHHPNIVQYYGSQEDKTKNTINIFMEFVSGGSLNGFVKKFKAIPLETMRQWIYQMVCGVRYLHDCGIVHRDIKGDNILVSIDGIVKLADFGCSKSIEDACSATHGCSTMVGTPYWMAPEVIKCEAGGYGAKSDIWSIGCTMVEMVTGRPPWPECNSMWAAVYKIANSAGLPTEIPKDLDPDLMDLLHKCFERNPRDRPTAAEMLQHPFLAGVAAQLPPEF